MRGHTRINANRNTLTCFLYYVPFTCKFHNMPQGTLSFPRHNLYEKNTLKSNTTHTQNQTLKCKNQVWNSIGTQMPLRYFESEIRPVLKISTKFCFDMANEFKLYANDIKALIIS